MRLLIYLALALGGGFRGEVVEHSAGVAEVADDAAGEVFHAGGEDFSTARAFPGFAVQKGVGNLTGVDVHQGQAAGRAVRMAGRVPKQAETQSQPMFYQKGDQPCQQQKT